MTSPVGNYESRENLCEEEVTKKTFVSTYGRTYEYTIPKSLENKETDSFREKAWKGMERNRTAQEQTGLDKVNPNDKAGVDDNRGLFFQEMDTYSLFGGCNIL